MFGLFNSDDGCDGHHFDDYEGTGVYKTESRKFQESVEIRELHVSRCLHSGCRKHNERWQVTGTLHMDTGAGRFVTPLEELNEME